MHRRQFNQYSVTALGAVVVNPLSKRVISPENPVRVGIIGLDTSHAVAFTKIINGSVDEEKSDTGFRVTHAYPQGSRDIESSTSRIPGYIEEMRNLKVEIVDSLEQLLDQTEAILLETNDGRMHLEQAIQVFEKGLITFIDKPIAASLADTIKIFKSAEAHQVPVFSASSLRFGPTTQEIARGNKIGKVIGVDVYSPAKIEKTHPDLFWYGIHGIESLFTLMGPGCEVVSRIHKSDVDLVTGIWADDRIGTFRGLRSDKTGYGGTAFGTEGISTAGQYEGYEPLVKEIINFFQTGKPPIRPEETIEIFAFMTAAEESKRRGGASVSLKDVMETAMQH